MSATPQDIDQSGYQEWIRSHNPELFELVVLAGVLRDNATFIRLSNVLCRRKTTYGWIQDFSDHINYKIYRAFFAACAMYGTADEGMFQLDFPEPCTWEYIMDGVTFMQTTPTADKIINEEDIDEMQARFNELSEVSDNYLKYCLTGPVVGAWILGQRSTRLLEEESLQGNSSIFSTVDELNELRTDLVATGSDSVFKAVLNEDGEVDSPNIERICIADEFPNMNEVLGGGLGKTEHIIVAAPTGQGKTVFACQLAGLLCMPLTRDVQPRHVLFISTEQPHTELIPRIISSRSYAMHARTSVEAIKAEVIKDGNYEALTKSQEKTKNIVLKEIQPYLHFVNWGAGAGSVQQLDSLIKAANKQFKVPMDVVILDWIGGALESITAQPEMKRLLYANAAKKMKDIAIKYNVACVSLAQTVANPKALTLGASDLHECKTIHYEAVAAFAYSAQAANPNADPAISKITYKKVQRCNAFKTRKGVTRYWAVERNFAYQRFEEQVQHDGSKIDTQEESTA